MGIPMLLACAGSQTGKGTEKIDEIQITSRQIREIADVEWHLQIMKTDNQTIEFIPDTKNTFSCDENGKVAGIATLNRYFGSFSFSEDGDIIWNKAFGMTRMAGPPNLMEQEAKFMQALPRTSRIYIKKQKLVMISTDRSTVLEFEKIK
jgi:heat shock protein HslJ